MKKIYAILTGTIVAVGIAVISYNTINPQIGWVDGIFSSSCGLSAGLMLYFLLSYFENMGEKE